MAENHGGLDWIVIDEGCVRRIDCECISVGIQFHGSLDKKYKNKDMILK